MIHKRKCHLTKKQYAHTTVKTIVTATFATTATTNSIVEAKSIEIKISRSV